MPPSDAPLDSGALYGALTALRAGTDVARAWRTIDRWMKSRFPAAKDDDARQAALLSVHRSVATMEASDPAGAAAWVRTIVQRKKIDLSRRDKRRRALSLVGSEGEDLEIEGSASVTLSEGHLEGILLDLEGALDRLLEERHPEPRQRIMPRAHARARLFRALGHGVAEVRELLGWTEPLSDAVISKWIERGLPVLSDAIDRWIDEAPSARTELGERLLERVELRRGDVGKPRHARRKTSTSPKGEGLSVAPRGGRRTERRRCAMPASSKFPARSKRSMGSSSEGGFWMGASSPRAREAATMTTTGLKRMIAWTLDLLDRASSDRASSDRGEKPTARRGLRVAGPPQAEEDAAREGRERIVEALAGVEALGLVLDAVNGPSVREALSLPTSALRALKARSRLLDHPTTTMTPMTATTITEDEGLAERHALALARRGLTRIEDGGRLGAAAPQASGSPGSTRVPEESLLRLLRGELDAFRAAEVAAQASRHAGTREELILLASHDAARVGVWVEGIAPLRLAADGPTPIRDPAQGVLVAKGGAKDKKSTDKKSTDKKSTDKKSKGSAKRASRSAPASNLEAFRFADGVVAIYAARPWPLTLVEGRGRGGSSPRVVGSAPGYLELSLPVRAQKRTLVIQVGLEDAELVELELP